ncbi:M6 family metalloprotease domain-containing protein [uncultured Sulfurimonas sp.]|uniref:M6 family metalloprotease domain-containing protein n=1 Tax=uncultured Sulfurimonas sp. TaxID=291845 RepID=UPI0032B26E7F
MIKIIVLTIISLIFLGCGSSDGSATTITLPQQEPEILPPQEPEILPPQEPVPFPVSESSIPMLCILVNYDDQKIISSDSVWSDKIFGKNNHQLNHYYQENSNFQFEFAKVSENRGILNDGIASVSLNKNHPNIDIDSSNFSSSFYPDLGDALRELDSDVDFSNFDNNADGYISSNELVITFIIAGYEDAYEGFHVANGIWAHQSCVSSTVDTVTLDSVTLMSCSAQGKFSLFGERHNLNNSHDATIGIIAHELGHSAFHLPDLYNTSNSNRGGIGALGLMGLGTWGYENNLDYPGNTPSHFCAWSKQYNNWLTPSLQTGYSNLDESSSLEYNVVKIPIDSTSYYLVENRNNSGYDKGLNALSGIFNGGVALWKIDESRLTQTYIDNNNVNADTQNKGVDLVEAIMGSIDSAGSYGDESALYYDSNVNSFENVISNVSSRGTLMSLNIN